MKLKSVETFVVGTPPPHYGGRYFIFVKLKTDNHMVGYGEVYGASFSPHVFEMMVQDIFQRYLFNKDPMNIEAFWRNVYGSGFSQRPDITLASVLSGLEMACWDIIGKSVGQPVYKLLGGQVHEKLRTYTYLYARKGELDDVYDLGSPSIYNRPELAAERAMEYVDMGFTAVKFDPAGTYNVLDGRQPPLPDIALSVSFMQTIRKAVGSKADLLFGTHGQFNAAGAIRLAKQIEAYDPLWFEEPVPPDSMDEMAKVAKATSIPIAAGERLCTKHEFIRLMATGAATIIQMNAGRVGGILEMKKIAGAAEYYHAHIAPHLYCGPIVGCANIHIGFCSPNFLILESIETWGGFYGELIHHEIKWEKGYILPPEKPGLGVTLNEDLVKAGPYKGDKLHLEMGRAYHQ